MKKKGISLIVLVITIIVIIILATAVIVTMVQNNPIENAKVAVLKSDAKTFVEELSLTLTSMKLDNNDFQPELLEAYTINDIQKYISSFNKKYEGKLCIHGGKLKYLKDSITEKEEKIFIETGLEEASNDITDAVAKYIKEKVDGANLASDFSTTDITEYVPDVSANQLEKFTIYKGKLYYRYEKTTYNERFSLQRAGITYLWGDASADGVLTEEDARMCDVYGETYERPVHDNMFYVCDLDSDYFVTFIEGDAVRDIVSGKKTVEACMTDKNQDLTKVRFVGDYLKWWLEVCDLPDSSSISASGYDELKEYMYEVTEEQAKRFCIIEGDLVYRYETLSEKEIEYIISDKMWMFRFLIGDGNFDGKLDKKDSDILKAYSIGEAEITAKQEKVLDVNGDGTVDAADSTLLQRYVAGTVDWSSLYSTYKNNMFK